MLNKSILMGRLTRDPEIRYTKNENKAVARFTLAVERNYGKGKEKETDFIDIVAWESRAEFVNQYFTKGQLVCVEGRLQRRQWTDDNGQNRYTFEIIAESVYFAEGKKKDSSPQSDDYYSEVNAGSQNAGYAKQKSQDEFDPFEDEDIAA